MGNDMEKLELHQEFENILLSHKLRWKINGEPTPRIMSDLSLDNDRYLAAATSIHKPAIARIDLLYTAMFWVVGAVVAIVALIGMAAVASILYFVL